MYNKNMRILVVDDFPTMRKLVRTALKQLNMTNVVEAKDGADAVGVIESERIDFVVSDWNMPLMTGIELLKWVRNHDDYNTMPFLMITAENAKENVIEALKYGVNNYIVKPFNAETLDKKISQIFRELDSTS